MTRKKALISLSVISALCGSIAMATTASEFKVTPVTTPKLSVQRTQGDSIRVIARWSRRCDVRGCPDSYRVNWTLGQSSSGAPTFTRTKTVAIDTVFAPAPAFGDSLRVNVSVAALRRGLASSPSATTTFIRRSDIAPPAVDSLRVDTLFASTYADTFTWTLRDTSGSKVVSRPPYGMVQWCTIAKNKFTGQFSVVLNPVWDNDLKNEIERKCERARAAVAAERSS